MKKEHDDGTWTCDNCQFQTNKSEHLRQHLKETGHQPSESSKRQSNETRQCYTCKEDIEGYTAMTNHRSKKHPSNKVCKNIPNCSGWVNGNKCWYVHPTSEPSPANKNTEIASPAVQTQEEIECRRCGSKFSSRNKFMTHYTTMHTGNIVCRDWLLNNCNRAKCWCRHSNTPSSNNSAHAQSVPTPQDFPNLLPPHIPPAQKQAPVQGQISKQSEIQKMITKMAMQMNTMELEVAESCKQMHILQQMLAKTQL